MGLVRRLASLALVAAVACTPEIPGGVYHCGPERSCPPDLSCDGVTAVCVYPGEARPFQCGEGASVAEPDDTLPLAAPLGRRGCGFESVVLEGCVDHADDVDHTGFTTSLDCDVRPFEARIRYPIAFGPVALELLDDAGEVLAAGAVCDELDDTGHVQVCLQASVPEDVPMYLRVRLEGALDCDGRCAHNRYRLSIL
jgi:hypothetical protein